MKKELLDFIVQWFYNLNGTRNPKDGAFSNVVNGIP